MSVAETPVERLRKAVHALSLKGAQSRDEAHALNLLSYYGTNQTLQKLVDAVRDGP